jgi:hypothetical protein
MRLSISDIGSSSSCAGAGCGAREAGELNGWLAGGFMLSPTPGEMANRSLSGGRGATLTGFSGIGAFVAGRAATELAGAIVGFAGAT